MAKKLTVKEFSKRHPSTVIGLTSAGLLGASLATGNPIASLGATVGGFHTVLSLIEGGMDPKIEKKWADDISKLSRQEINKIKKKFVSLGGGIKRLKDVV